MGGVNPGKALPHTMGGVNPGRRPLPLRGVNPGNHCDYGGVNPGNHCDYGGLTRGGADYHYVGGLTQGTTTTSGANLNSSTIPSAAQLPRAGQ